MLTRVYNINDKYIIIQDNYFHDKSNKSINIFDDNENLRIQELCKACKVKKNDYCYICENNYKNGWIRHSILTDDSGKDYFMYKDTKVYYDTWLRMSYSDFKRKLKTNHKDITIDDFINLILTEGKDNLQFKVPMYNYTTSYTKSIMCKIDESKYSIQNTYKIGMHIIDESDEIIDYDDFYISDFVENICKGKIKIYLSKNTNS